MEKLNSLSLFVGTGKCNANCNHCAGKIHRKYAPYEDGVIDAGLIYDTLIKSYADGARSLTISSSGEPTLSPLSVTKVLGMVHDFAKEGSKYEWINLYSNGIRIGEDEKFCDNYLKLWKDLGLGTIYITVHDLDEKKNAEFYQIKEYPSLEKIVSRIHGADLFTRANVVLTKDNIGTFEKYLIMVKNLKKIGFDHISAWPIRGQDDKLDLELAPSKEELDKMGNWADEHDIPKCRLRVLREKNRTVYETGQKLTLFPDGTLFNTWCNS